MATYLCGNLTMYHGAVEEGARIISGDHARVEIHLGAGLPGELPAWVVVELPGPLASEKVSGDFRIDARLDDLKIHLEWGEVLAVPKSLPVLTVRFAEQTWRLQQDTRHVNRWKLVDEHDHTRSWS